MICKKTHSFYAVKCCYNDLCVYHELTNHNKNLEHDFLSNALENNQICKDMIPFIKNKIEELS